MGYVRRATDDDPSTFPGEPGTPATVVTTPEEVTDRMAWL
jgi:hypothetical protein